MRERNEITGRVRLVFRNEKTGKITNIQHTNLFVNTGRNKIRDYLAGDSPSYPTHCAISDDPDIVSAASVDIGVETISPRLAFTEKIKRSQEIQINTYYSSATAQGEYIQKAGLVDAESGGTFFAIALFTRRQKDPNETLTIEWILGIGG
jgi:hypothetical protein